MILVKLVLERTTSGNAGSNAAYNDPGNQAASTALGTSIGSTNAYGNDPGNNGAYGGNKNNGSTYAAACAAWPGYANGSTAAGNGPGSIGVDGTGGSAFAALLAGSALTI